MGISQCLSAQIIQINNSAAIFSLKDGVQWYSDKTSQKSINDLSEINSAYWTTSKEKVVNYGLTNNAIWCQFTLASNQEDALQLLIANVNIDSVQLFYFLNNRWQVLSVGHKIQKWNILSNAPFYSFNLPIIRVNQKVFIRFKSRNTLVIPIFAGIRNEVEKKVLMHLISEGIFAGIFISLIIYNFIFWLVTKEKVYLYYFSFIIASASYILLYLKGWSHFFNQSVIHFISNYAFAICNLGYFFSIQFSREFLKKSIDNWLIITSKILQLIVLVIATVNFFGFYIEAIKSTQLIHFPFVIVVLLMLRSSHKNGNSSAKFLLIGWGLFFLSLIVFTMALINIFPFNLFILNLPQYGLTIELLWISFYLSYSLNKLKEEKHELSLRTIALVSTKNEELEKLVSERTKELNETNILKDRIMASISHDLRMPLVNTLGLVELMENGLLKPKEKKNKIGQIKFAITEIANNMNNLIKWSSIQLGNSIPALNTVNLADEINEILKLYELSIIEKAIRIHFNYVSYIVFIDLEHLKLALRNLISNAVKHNNIGGEILIDCMALSANPKKVLVTIKNSININNLKEIKESSNQLIQSNRSLIPLDNSKLGLLLTREFLNINDANLQVEIVDGYWISSFELNLINPLTHI